MSRGGAVAAFGTLHGISLIGEVAIIQQLPLVIDELPCLWVVPVPGQKDLESQEVVQVRECGMVHSISSRLSNDTWDFTSQEYWPTRA